MRSWDSWRNAISHRNVRSQTRYCISISTYLLTGRALNLRLGPTESGQLSEVVPTSRRCEVCTANSFCDSHVTSIQCSLYQHVPTTYLPRRSPERCGIIRFERRSRTL